MYIILFLGTLFIFQNDYASSFSPTLYTDKHLPMVWLDGRYRDGPLEVNTFFDRVVVIYLFDSLHENDTLGEPLTHKATGVFIKTHLVLTSFNAFRNLSSIAGTLDKMRVLHVYSRTLSNESRAVNYTFNKPNLKDDDFGLAIVCGRQVIPSDSGEWPIHMRHGPNTPAHDLMVLRLKTPVEFINPIPSPREDFLGFTSAGAFEPPDKFSPIRTILARPGNKMYIAEMRFVSVGHLSEEHIGLRSYLEKGEFGNIEDCEDWLPREWGHFICLGNTENYPGLAAGAMLFSGEQLFGVGAFMLKKGKDNILVFTDVRPYWHLLYRTCSKDDQNGVINKH